jgi:hypothetical protein
MPQLTFRSPFTFRRDDGTEQTYQPGTQEVPDADAKHWFVRAHAENADDLPPEDEPDAPAEDPSAGSESDVTIVKPFILQRDDGVRIHYGVGTHTMPAGDAEHWFTKFHSDDPPPTDYPAGTPEYAHQQMEQQARRRLHDAAIDQEAHMAALELKDRRKGRGGRKQEHAPEPDTAETAPPEPYTLTSSTVDPKSSTVAMEPESESTDPAIRAREEPPNPAGI